jgi:hypothetical protein
MVHNTDTLSEVKSRYLPLMWYDIQHSLVSRTAGVYLPWVHVAITSGTVKRVTTEFSLTLSLGRCGGGGGHA